MEVKKGVNWKLYFILLMPSILSVITVFPYVLSLQGEVLKEIPLPLPVVLLLSLLQSSIIFAILIFIGLKLSKKVGLGLPILESYIFKKKTAGNIKSIIKISVIFGFLAGVVIILLDLLFIKLGINLSQNISIPIWQGFIASFYGGIGEEILLRLFLMTLIVWIISKFTKSKAPIKNNNIMWISIIIAALLFGVGHLPATAGLISLTPLVIFRALLLNGIGGIVFGWLYWKKGLESAMIAHFSTDIVFQVIFPLILLF